MPSKAGTLKAIQSFAKQAPDIEELMGDVVASSSDEEETQTEPPTRNGRGRGRDRKKIPERNVSSSLSPVRPKKPTSKKKGAGRSLSPRPQRHSDDGRKTKPAEKEKTSAPLRRVKSDADKIRELAAKNREEMKNSRRGGTTGAAVKKESQSVGKENDKGNDPPLRRVKTDAERARELAAKSREDRNSGRRGGRDSREELSASRRGGKGEMTSSRRGKTEREMTAPRPRSRTPTRSNKEGEVRRTGRSPKRSASGPSREMEKPDRLKDRGVSAPERTSRSPVRDSASHPRERSSSRARTRRQVGAAQQHQLISTLGPQVPEPEVNPYFGNKSDEDESDESEEVLDQPEEDQAEEPEETPVEPRSSLQRADAASRIRCSATSTSDTGSTEVDDSRRGMGLARAKAKREVKQATGEAKHTSSTIAPGTYRSLINS